jgi:predicted ATPase with chaperone activity
MKANGGIFLVDDFGRQRMNPKELLNRWIVPMENQIDYLSLANGQKIQIPFELCLIFATNLNPSDVTDPAFLRRIGFRLQVKPPEKTQYAQIFNQYLKKMDVNLDDSSLDWLFQQYEKEGRELRGCEPRDLLERVRDLCKYRGEDVVSVNPKNLEFAWRAYFGGASIPE